MTASAALVVCAGIPRSGSTWLYNAARLLLQHAAGDANAVYGAWIERYDSANPARWHVVKVHEPDESLVWRAKVALTSRRDLRDIAASAWKRGWINDEASTLAFLDNVVRQHAFWSQRCAFEMVYERMIADRPGELACIARVLEVDAGEREIKEVSAAIDALGFDDASEGEFDPSNLLHKRHIADGRAGYHASVLPADLVSTIGQRHEQWLRANGCTTA